MPTKTSTNARAKATAQFNQLRAKLEEKSFLDLNHDDRRSVEEITGPTGILPVEAWSFVPHPDVLPTIKLLQRYIVTIDTNSSEVYFPVLNFLKSQKANVTSYYSGGWADFVCDISIDEKKFDAWCDGLRAVLHSANADRFYHDINKLFTIFKVGRPYVICGSLTDSLGRPKASTLKEIAGAREKFELAYRNYRSEETRAAFNNDDKALRNYLRSLKRDGVILCYRIVTDTPRYFSRDYVALSINSRVVNTLVEELKNDALRAPVQEFFPVTPIQCAEELERSITNLFVNAYDIPGERIDWKLKIYEWGVRDVNLFNYPLEGTVNETPIYLSDYPEFLERSTQYLDGKAPEIGRAYHPVVPKSGPVVSLPIEGIGYGGVTLGIPQSGKTNADVVVGSRLLPFVTNVVFLDGTKGVWPVVAESKDLSSKTTRIEIAKSTPIAEKVAAAIATPGMVILEFQKESLGEVLDEIMETITSKPNASRGGVLRTIKNVLMIEEAADLWIGDENVANERAGKLLRFLDEAMRKGWCVWLSTQQPAKLGPDEENSLSLLKALKNRIVMGVDNAASKKMLLEVLREEGHSEEDMAYVANQIDSRVKGRGLLRAVKADAVCMPPIFVTFPLVGSS